MKKLMKRVLAVALAAIMTGGTAAVSSQTAGMLLPAVAHAEQVATSGSCGDNATWSYDSTSDTLTISGTGTVTSAPWRDTDVSSGYIETLVIEEGITDFPIPSGDYGTINIPSTFEGKIITGEDEDLNYKIAYLDFSEQLFVKKFVVDENNQTLSSVDGVLFNKEKTILLRYPVLSERKSYTVPDGVKEIATYAFSVVGILNYNDNSKRIVWLSEDNFESWNFFDIDLNNTEYLDSGAFFYSAIEELTLSEKIKKVYYSAFDLTFIHSGKLTVLNPNLERFSLPFTSDENGAAKLETIVGYTHSVAEEMAASSNIPFVPLDDISVTGVEITTLPDKTEFLETDNFETDGMVLTVSYSDGVKDEKDYTCLNASGFNRQNYGKNTITVSYRGFSDTYDINITEVPTVTLNEHFKVQKQDHSSSGYVKFVPTADNWYTVNMYKNTTDSLNWDIRWYELDENSGKLKVNFGIEYERLSLETGKTYYLRVYCDTTDDVEFAVECGNHKYILTSGNEPTCTSGGCPVYTCSVCGATKGGEYLEPLGHGYYYPISKISPTCVNNGEYYKICGRCGEKLDVEIIPATGHSDNNNDGYCDDCGTDLYPSMHCTHSCHKTGIARFFWKFANFFNKIFKIKQYCDCGAKHW